MITPPTAAPIIPSTRGGDIASGRTAFRLVASCVLLFGLAFIQDPGLLTSDTKFDLVAAPADFLGRALHLWDGEGAFGQLQNQAYGYLWPMGPFFLVGWAVAIPGWIIQRLWLGLVMSVAFVGTARVARALGVRSDLAVILAGLAFALSPRMLTTLGPISIEAWPSAMAPWVLLPLVRGSTQGSPRRAAALSALAVGMVGGVNAAATLAVLPLGVVWLLTRTPGPRRRALMLWWPAFTVLATLWWLIPLLVMGAYSPPFLDFIETTSVTTFPTTLFDTLRGTSDWVPYVDARSRAGNDLLTTSYLVLDSGVVLLVGFAGLLDRRTPHRTFFALAVFVGVLMVAAGHGGSVHGWFAGSIRGLLDGSLSPLRNVHKFDPILRLPLALGVAFVVDRAVRSPAARARGEDAGPSDRWRRASAQVRFNQAALVGMTALAVLGAAMPAFAGRIAPAGGTLGVPQYWQAAADWLAKESGRDAALVIPGAPFAQYLWGSTQDEPLQYLAHSRWATRNVIPLVPPGNIRMLDGLEARLAQGDGSPGLTAYLRRAGVRFLVVRNDLERASDVPDPVLVHQALEESPGLSRVATFGPDVGGGSSLAGAEGRVVINGGWQAEYPAVEIFSVAGQVSAAVASSTPAVVAGGPEDLVDLLDLGVIGDEPVLLAADASASQVKDVVPGRRVVLTDGLRARERFFARIHDGASAAITPGDVRRSGNPARDYLLDSRDRWSTTVRLQGARGISASSSMSDAEAWGGSRRGELPYAAVDGSPDTAWVSGLGERGRAWWRIVFDESRIPGVVTLIGGPTSAPNQMVRVRTQNGLSAPLELGPGQRQEIYSGGGVTNWLQVENADESERSISLAEVHVAGLRVKRALVLPQLPDAWGNPDTVVLRRDRDARTGCARIGSDVRCVAGRERASEEPLGMERVFSLAHPGSFRTSLVVRPRAGSTLDALALRDRFVNIAASSVAVPDERASALAAIDGNPGTAWMAAEDDLRPALYLSWLGKRRITALRLTLDDGTAASLPRVLQLTWPGGTRKVTLDDEGRTRLRHIRTDRLTIRVDAVEPTTDLGFDARSSPVNAGIGELHLAGVRQLHLDLSRIPVTYPCGVGPQLVVDGQRYATAVTESPAHLARGKPGTAQLCEPSSNRSQHRQPAIDSHQSLQLAAGEHDLRFTDSAGFAMDSAVLDNEAGPGSETTTMEDAGPIDEGPATRKLLTGPGDAIVVMRENANPGWRATQEGSGVQSLVLDGWQQGWQLRRPGTSVEAVFAPDRPYRWGLLVGLAAVVGLLVALVLTRRRWAGPLAGPTEDREIPAPVMASVAALGVGLLAGWLGLLVGLSIVVVTMILRRRAPGPAPWLLAAPCLIAAGAYAVSPWGGSSQWAGSESWPHYLVLVPLVALLVSGVGVRRSLPMFFRRMAGRSTSR